MCRNIKRLRHPDHAPSEAELHDAALQFVRKISGYRKPSRLNEAVIEAAVEDIAAIAGRLLASLQAGAPARTRSEQENRTPNSSNGDSLSVSRLPTVDSTGNRNTSVRRLE
jgi:hypothetical protein